MSGFTLAKGWKTGRAVETGEAFKVLYKQEIEEKSLFLSSDDAKISVKGEGRRIGGC